LAVAFTLGVVAMEAWGSIFKKRWVAVPQIPRGRTTSALPGPKLSLGITRLTNPISTGKGLSD
jgi:hypothetical protein